MKNNKLEILTGTINDCWEEKTSHNIRLDEASITIEKKVWDSSVIPKIGDAMVWEHYSTTEGTIVTTWLTLNGIPVVATDVNRRLIRLQELNYLK